jgi:predicted nucleotidyltransferase
MSMTARELPLDSLKKYRPLEAIRRRKRAMSADLSKRRRRAIFTAGKAAELLRREFGVNEVIVFGSLARYGSFTLWSDIDIAAKGIPPARFFEAVGVITGMSSEFKIDLLDLEACPSSMRERIERDGKDL